MKKTFVFFLLLGILIIPTLTFAKQGCCSWHGGVAYCASNGRYVCNDQTYSPSCTCGSYKPYTTPKETPNQKCNKKYPGTIYRSADNRCACPGDKVGTSSRSPIYGCSSKTYNTNSTSTKTYNNNTTSKTNKDIQCNKKYPGTIYRSADNRCACQGDKVGTSSRNKVTKSCKQTSVYFN